MNKNNLIILIGIGLVLFIFFMKGSANDIQAVTGSETMTRVASASVISPGQTFTITYTAVGSSGNWVATVVDDVTGGCTPAHKETLFVHGSGDANTKDVTFTAPSSAASCVFNGNYQFGNKTIKNFQPLTVSSCAIDCTRPADLCLASKSDGCGGTCNFVVTKNTVADTNCDNAISLQEIVAYGTLWLNGQVTRPQLAAVAQVWSG